MRILWIEDQFYWIAKIGPTLATLPGMTLSVLFYGTVRNTAMPSYVKMVPCNKRNPISFEDAWSHVEQYFALGDDAPWLAIIDLQLEPINSAFLLSTDGGDINATGVLFTKQLFRQTPCRNVIWLTQWGDVATSRTNSFVTDKQLEAEYGAAVISFPRTYVLHKDVAADTLRDLIERIAFTARKELWESYAIARIRPSVIIELFAMFLEEGHLGHYFTHPRTAEELMERKRRLARVDLLPFHEPPMSFDTWHRMYRAGSELSFDDLSMDNRETFADELVQLLGKLLWGAEIKELPALIKFAAGSHNAHLLDTVGIDGLSSEKEHRVIGPLVRERLLCVISNAVRNALRHRVPSDDRIYLRALKNNESICLLIINKVENAGRIAAEMRDAKTSLSGILRIRQAIQLMNRLHPAQYESKLLFGGWGFAMYVNRTPLYRRKDAPAAPAGDREYLADSGDSNAWLRRSERNWFSVGFEMPEVAEWAGENELAKDSVCLAIRMPLVKPEHLASRDGSMSLKTREISA